MKTRQIKKQSELPASFSLRKYTDVGSFDLCDWIGNLEARVLIAAEAKERPFAKPEHDFRKLCDKLLEQPLRAARQVYDNVVFSKTVATSTVVDYTAGNVYWTAWEYIHGRYSKYLGKPSALDSQDIWEPDADLDLPFYKMILHEGDLYAKVNLHASDEQIMMDFAAWLQAARRATGIAVKRKRYDQADLDQWEKNKILPYLDLTLWARANNVEITQQALGAALFPDEYEVNLAERIRKVIAPAARSMLEYPFIDSLHQQVIAEQRASSGLPPV